MSLNQTLAALGFTTAPAGNGWNQNAKHVMRDGTIVFTGDSVEVWEWLKARR